MPKVNPRIRFIERFLAHFNCAFSTKHQRSIFKEFIYAMFSDYKRMSLAAIANNTAVNYQRLQYFFSEADWNNQDLNDIRLKILQNQRTTKANKKGVLAIDDTACPKPYAEKTEGASFQHCGCLGREENANVAVASCFVSNSKHFPVDFKSYLPITTPNPKNFKSKLDLAKELIDDAVNKKIPFSSVVVDAWYTSTDLIEFTASKNLTLVAEVKINRSIFFTHPMTRQWRYLTGDKIIALIKEFYPHKLKTVSIPQEDGTDKNVLYYAFKSKLRDCATEVQVIFLFDKWSDADDKDVHILITTDLNMTVRSTILTYLLRWGIEESFRELKDTFCFDQYQVRHQEQIQKHWIMSFLAWTLAYWIKQNGCLSKILDEPPQTIGECKQAIASLIIIDSSFLLSKNKELAASLYHIKSERFKKNLEKIMS
ncbi:IS701 family transposase [Candidatus Jorgensenbacteria bacterium]|nr:IS701 family transposase [Candidatus Jorgensenbacteria bacterium]